MSVGCGGLGTDADAKTDATILNGLHLTRLNVLLQWACCVSIGHRESILDANAAKVLLVFVIDQQLRLLLRTILQEFMVLTHEIRSIKFLSPGELVLRLSAWLLTALVHWPDLVGISTINLWLLSLRRVAVLLQLPKLLLRRRSARVQEHGPATSQLLANIICLISLLQQHIVLLLWRHAADLAVELLLNGPG